MQKDSCRGGMDVRTGVGADRTAAHRRKTWEVRMESRGARQTHVDFGPYPEDHRRGLRMEGVDQVYMLARSLWTPAQNGLK